MSKTKLKLTAWQWYGWQVLPGYSGEQNVPYFSPIWVEVVTPWKTRRSIVTLQFFNVSYAEGVSRLQD